MTDTSYSWSDSRAELSGSKKSGKPSSENASEYEEETGADMEPSMESQQNKSAQSSRPPSQGKRSVQTRKLMKKRQDPIHNKEPAFHGANPRRSVKKASPKAAHDEVALVGPTYIDDSDLTKGEKEIINLRGKATMMKVCMESCTSPILKRQGKEYKGKYHNIDDIIAEWKANPPIPSDDIPEMTQEYSEPILESRRTPKRSRPGYDTGHREEDYSNDFKTYTPQQRSWKQQSPHANEKHKPHHYTQGGVAWWVPLDDKEQASRNIHEPAVMQERKVLTTPKPTRKPGSGGSSSQQTGTEQQASAANRNSRYDENKTRKNPLTEKEIEDKEKGWCEEKCKELVWGADIEEKRVQKQAMGGYINMQDLDQQMWQEPEMTASRVRTYATAHDDSEDELEHEAWCDKQCKIIARLPDIWNTDDPSGIIVKVLSKGGKYDQPECDDSDTQEPTMTSAPVKNRRPPKTSGSSNPDENHNAHDTEEEKKIQSFIGLCRKVCMDRPKKSKKPKLTKAQQNELAELERRARAEDQYQRWKMRKTIIETCMEKFEKAAAEGSNGKYVRQENRGDPLQILEPEMSSVPPKGNMSQSADENTPALNCEGMKRICEKLADDLVELHFKYGGVSNDYKSEINTFENIQEPKMESGNTRKLKRTLKTEMKNKLKDSDSEPKFKTMKQNLSTLRTRISRASIEDSANAEGTVAEPSSSKLMATEVRPTREPQTDQVVARQGPFNTLVKASPEETSREDFYQALEEFEDPGGTTKERFMNRSRNPKKRNQHDQEHVYDERSALHEPILTQRRHHDLKDQSPRQGPGSQEQSPPSKKLPEYNARTTQTENQNSTTNLQPGSNPGSFPIKQKPEYYDRTSQTEGEDSKKERQSGPQERPSPTKHPEELQGQVDVKQHIDQEPTLTQMPAHGPESQERPPSPTKPTQQRHSASSQTEPLEMHHEHQLAAGHQSGKPSTEHHEWAWTEKQSEPGTSNREQSPTQKPQPDSSIRTDHHEETSAHQQRNLPPLHKDSEAQTSSPQIIPSARVTGHHAGPSRMHPSALKSDSTRSLTRSLTTSSSRVMFIETPITTPPESRRRSISITSELFTRCDSDESCNDCGHAKSRPQRGCLKCPVSSERRSYSKTRYLEEEQVTKLRESLRSSPSPVRNDYQTVTDPNLLKGTLGEALHRGIPDISIDTSHHSLTVCAQADARQRLIDKYMIDALGLQGIEPIVVEKSIGGCKWGVKAYRV